jgi:phosphoribosyl 1,2-cyclic phosphodiesterase
MKVVVLASGSKGNTTYVEGNGTRLLIDIGNTCKYVIAKLEELGVDSSSLDGILISHTHKDHIGGLKVFLKKNDVKVYLTRGMLEEMDYVDNYEILDDDEFDVGNLHVKTVKTSHDSVDSRGFIVSDDHSSMVQITDTGYINENYYSELKNRDLYVIESNYDIEMLTNGPYPYQLRHRVLSDKGHLSNYDSARYVSEFLGERTRYVLLAHLSQHNNTPELAYQELAKRLEHDKKNVDKIIITEQTEKTELIEI